MKKGGVVVDSVNDDGLDAAWSSWGMDMRFVECYNPRTDNAR